MRLPGDYPVIWCFQYRNNVVWVSIRPRCSARLTVQAAATRQKRNLMNSYGIVHYESPEGDFALDVPADWQTAPAVPDNSPHELIRFHSDESKNFLTIIFRETLVFVKGRDVEWALKWHALRRQQLLSPHGYQSFVGTPVTIQSRPGWRLDFEKLGNWGTWHCRYYFTSRGDVLYRVGFGTSDKAGMFPVFDEVAQSFTIKGMRKRVAS